MSDHDLGAQTTGARAARRWTLALALLVASAAVLGFLGGSAWSRHRTDLGGWHTAVAQTGTDQISIEFDGWTYGASDSVGRWLDRAGSWHESGWPECLRVPAGREVSVRFQARPVTIDGIATRLVVAIDCRGAAAVGR